MVEIRLTNTRTRKKEVFQPLDAGNVRLYLCGPTVYDRAHLGNARPVLVFDVLVRLLHHVYGRDHVTYVRNFTDVDDKINARAAETGRSIREITEETIGWYHDDMDALGAQRPDHEPRATDYITQMVAMIERLIESNHAYAAEGHVLFDVRSFPDYGSLSGRSVDDMIAGARVEVAPFKREPMDFVLWKPSTGDLPGWDSPWGRGRPGWHIECSAMSEALLGPSFDIHGGGIDLQFPHHENEIAQSCCAHPQADFARVWLHNEMLQVEGKKMSKSLGNFFTVRDLLDRPMEEGGGVPGEVIRFVMLSTHYRKPMDWTEAKAQEAEAVLRRWRGLAAGIEPAASPAPALMTALADDLNTAGAMAVLHDLAGRGDAAGLLASARMLGLLLPDMGAWAEAGDDTAALIEGLLAARSDARKVRDFARADAIRDGFAGAGVEVKDTPAGAEWSLAPGFDAARLAELARALGS
ncbi:cysteinyl-tRNA synthetase [Paracoccus alcaliphilus]|uniref:Cysteine--tRNA ligase n=1 Tax=Paracoccus alcaliphilus TaxID=34002 RepID=A0A1H8DYK7_9RHOB|nr:cysteine--tRNA ligase [Paracoccus alcaliphilus]WCR19929.1 cysteine--tRNA ligase [Paracoccus alcaliphilus]SEN12246.1 cysteinyl-tRNA synthetase [Paracoccus alcaliphilus]